LPAPWVIFFGIARGVRHPYLALLPRIHKRRPAREGLTRGPCGDINPSSW
jgi:hypothetical protein